MAKVDETIKTNLLKQLVNIMDFALKQPGNNNDQYFDILSLILDEKTIKDNIKSESDIQDPKNICILTFKTLFNKIDSELQKLLH